MDKYEQLAHLCKRVRYGIITSTTQAGSGHPTSSLSAVELMTTLFFGGFLKQDTLHPHSLLNDKVIFSKGHASPLLYSLYEAAGAITFHSLMTLRTFSSRLQGHPTPEFPFADIATGSLGQGLSAGVGMALGIRLLINQGRIHMKREPTVWVLLGDSEMAEGQIWEAMEAASYYSLNNLVGILDINRLGQSGETELGWAIDTYKKRIEAFGWKTMVLENGHNLDAVYKALKSASSLNTIHRQKPLMILARTVKGKGVSFLENKPDWHGKPVPKNRLSEAVDALGDIDFGVGGTISPPEGAITTFNDKEMAILWRLEQVMMPVVTSFQTEVKTPEEYATREAFGDALTHLGGKNKRIVAVDAEVGNSTYLDKFAKACPERFFQMFIDEENMASVSLGLAKMGFVPYFSTFAAFLTRAYDQIRMMQYSLVGKHSSQQITINIIGSHAGVSIGQDGPSQMGLEDISMMRSIQGSTVLYPGDAVSTNALTKTMSTRKGINYLRTTRGKTPAIYSTSEKFPIGEFKIVRQDKNDVAVVIAAGITLREALKAYERLTAQGISITVVDLYSVKPLNEQGLRNLAKKTKHIVVVEDHYSQGGIGEAVLSALVQSAGLRFTHLCVRKTPRSGTPEELLRYEEIDARAIIESVVTK